MEEVYVNIKNGELSPNENLAEKIERINKKEERINSFITVLENPSWGDGLLKGIVLGVKDNFAVRGVRMTCGSKMLENYIAPYDATVVKRVKDEGGIIIGKNNMDEFACGSSGETSYFGPTRNPLNEEYVPGGSSSGSAAAVAAGFVDAAIASDTGGSIRNPASFCGVVGLKPTYGLVSRYGLADLAMSMDCPGVLARDAFGVALLMDVINGPDPKDPTTSRKLEFMKNLDSFDPEKVKIGYYEELFNVEKNVREKTLKTLKFFENKGCEIVEIEIPSFKYALASYYLCVYAEFASAMQKFDGLKYGHSSGENDLFALVSKSRGEAFGKEVKRRIILGTYISMKEYYGKWYTKAVVARRKIKEEFENVLKKVDIILCPTMPLTPFKIGEKIEDPVEMYMCDILTVPPNLAGLPAISFPAGEVGDFFVGVQLIGRRFEDDLLVSAVRFFEKEGGS